MTREKSEKKTNMSVSDFEFCKICKINHNQGRRHNFFPRHKNSLSSLFSRFSRNLSAVNFAVKNPSFLLPSDASKQQIWCIFCDSDIDELGSTFSSGNAIKHLAGQDHLKNLKHFLWKYGGGMDKLDSFRITETELAKWQKKCEGLRREADSSSEAASSSKRDCRPSSCGQLNDIQPNYAIVNTFDRNNIQFFESDISINVIPLQCDTNENYQVYRSDISEAGKVRSCLQAVASPLPLVSQHGSNNWNSAFMSHNGQHSSVSTSATFLAHSFVSTEVGKNQSVANGDTITEGHQSLTRIFPGALEDIKGNVHSGATPPWLEGIEQHGNNGKPNTSRVNGAAKNSGKTSKLNPNRVGAAWAEKRKIEMEREKRGEIVANDSDTNWLPNFGRVWQSGSRKESMKEFKKEKLNIPKDENQDIIEIKIHPYVSKRMRLDTNGVSSEGVQSGVDSSETSSIVGHECG